MKLILAVLVTVGSLVTSAVAATPRRIPPKKKVSTSAIDAKGGKAVIPKDNGYLPGSPQATQACNPPSNESCHFPSGNIVPCRGCLKHEANNLNASTHYN